jgi:hypothetical protein
MLASPGAVTLRRLVPATVEALRHGHLTTAPLAMVAIRLPQRGRAWAGATVLVAAIGWAAYRIAR